jgi:serine/threonine protein kinase/PKD repeat protein
VLEAGVGGERPGSGDGTPAGVFVGSRIGGYRLEEQVGAGGMAVVYRAVDERLGRPVALKVLTPELAGDDALRARFIGESRAAAQVQDPHLIPVHEAGEAGGVMFIAMQYVAGGDVRSLLRRGGPLPAARAAAIVSAVASALDAAHRAGLVHRDVKPANMLLDVGHGRPDHVYLTDFGISRQTRAAGLTGAGQFLGTVEYAAPEQIRGAAVDGRADQYALGCTAFELLSGQQPFARNEAAAVIWAQLTEPPPSVRSRRPDLPPAVDGVLARALAKSPERRYATCREFADALRGALGLDPYDSVPPGIPQDGRWPARPVAEPATGALGGDPSLGTTRTRPAARRRASPPSAPPARPEPGPLPSPSGPPPRRRRWLFVSLAAVIAAGGLAVGVHLATSGAKAASSLGRATSAAATTCRTPTGTAALSLSRAVTHETVVTIRGVVTAPRGTVLRAIDWNWGDGTRQTGCALRQTHVYPAGRRYTIRVTAAFSNGSRLHASEAVSLSPPITTCPISNGPAVLSLDAAAVAGNAVTITGQLVAPRGTKLTDIDWNWGDGIAQAGCAYFPETHDYARPGRYTIVVTARFSNGSREQAAEQVSVRPAAGGPGPSPSGVPTPAASGTPSPSPTASPGPAVAAACQTTNGTSSLTLFPATVLLSAVTINGVVIAPSGTKLTAIDWNWGDGVTLTGCSYFPETHVYASVGRYRVVVTTTFSNGQRLEATETVTVGL